MPAFITNTVHIQRYADAVYGVQVGSATLAQINQDIISLGGIDKALNAYFAGAGQTNATVAANIVKNVGIVAGGTITAAAVTDATAYVLGQLNANKGNEGATIKSILNLVGNLTADPIYGSAAVKFNADVDNAIAYTGAGDVAAGTVTPVSFTLTTGVDTVTGTSGNDTFTADNTGSVKQAGAADTVNGGSGTDTLNVFLKSDDTTLTLPTLNSVENVYLNGGALTSLTAAAGSTGLSIDSPVQAIAADGSAVSTGSASYRLTGQSLTLANLVSATGTSVITANTIGAVKTFTTSIDSTADTVANITVNGLASKSRVHTYNNAGSTNTVSDTQTVDLTGTKFVTLNLTGATAASTFTLANSGAALKTLNIAGSQNETIVVAAGPSAGLTTINAGTATGRVSVDTVAGTANALLAFSGGSGNDTLKMAASSIVSTQTIDGGTGTDTLSLNDVSLTSTQARAINAVKNFEVLGFNGGGTAGVAADVSTITAMSTFNVTTAVTGAAGGAGTANTSGGNGGIGAAFSGQSNQTFISDAAITGGAGGASSANNANSTGGTGGAGLQITPALDSGSNAVSLTLSGVTITGGAGSAKTAGGTGTDGSGGAAVDLTSYESIAIVSNTNSAGTTTTNTFTGGAKAGNATDGAGLIVGTNATITITGAASLSTGIISGTNLTINAAAMTRDLTATTGDGNDTITGGSGVNTLTMAGGVDSINLTASATKADVITFNTGNAAATVAGSDGITSFVNGTTIGDKLDIASGTTLALAATGNTSTANANAANQVIATINSTGIAVISGLGASATFADYITAVFGAINATGREAAFQFGNDTYIVADQGTAGSFTANTDFVVKLVGVTGVTAVSVSASAANTVWAV